MIKSMPLLVAKAVTVLFVFFLFPGLSIAQVAEKIGPNSMGRWVVGGFEIYLDIKCGISRSKIWPEKYCGEPYVVISKGEERERDSLITKGQYFKLVVADVELGDKWMFDGNEDPLRRVPLDGVTFGDVRSTALFKVLMSKENLKINFLTRGGRGSSVDSRWIVLAGFKSYAAKEIKSINYHYSQEESNARKGLVVGLIMAAIVLATAFWIARYLFKKTRAKMAAVKEHIETRRVSRVAEDEAIRVVVRDTVQKVDSLNRVKPCAAK